VLVVGFAVAGVTSAGAQVRFGANLSWGSKTDLGLGARLNFGLGDMASNQPVEGLVTFDYFFPGESTPGNDVTYWTVTANAIYRFTQRSSSVAPYAGGGVMLGRASSDAVSPGPGGGSGSKVGLHAVGGLRFKTAGTVLPFVEGRLELKDSAQFVLSGGVFFGQP
jgi:hypothetical protein